MRHFNISHLPIEIYLQFISNIRTGLSNDSRGNMPKREILNCIRARRHDSRAEYIYFLIFLLKYTVGLIQVFYG